MRWQPNCLRGFCFPYMTSQSVWLPELSKNTTITTTLLPSCFYYLRGVQGKKKSVSFGTSRSCLSEEVIFLWTRLELSSYNVTLPFLIVANYLFPLLGFSQRRAGIAPRQVQDSVTSKETTAGSVKPLDRRARSRRYICLDYASRRGYIEHVWERGHFKIHPYWPNDAWTEFGILNRVWGAKLKNSFTLDDIEVALKV